MSELGYEILAAGRLTEPAIGSDASRTVNEGMPNVTSGPSGQVTFAYLTRAQTKTSWRLCLTALSLEKGTGKPVIERTPAPIEVVADGLLPIPPTFSTDGQAVFAPTEDGQIEKYSSLPSSPERPGRHGDRLITRRESTEGGPIAMAALVSVGGRARLQP